MEPEVWVSIGRAAQKQLREEWQKSDPETFNAQELRRTKWQKAKSKGTIHAVIPSVAVVRQQADAQLARHRPEDPPPIACPARAGNDGARALYRRVRAMILSGDYFLFF